MCELFFTEGVKEPKRARISPPKPPFANFKVSIIWPRFEWSEYETVKWKVAKL